MTTTLATEDPSGPISGRADSPCGAPTGRADSPCGAPTGRAERPFVSAGGLSNSKCSRSVYAWRRTGPLGRCRVEHEKPGRPIPHEREERVSGRIPAPGVEAEEPRWSRDQGWSPEVVKPLLR